MQPSFQNRVTLRRLPMVALVTYGIALLAWVAIVTRWLPMPRPGAGVEMQMSDPGVPEAMALSNGLVGAGLYLVIWTLMMVAMMYPSSVALFRLYYKTLDETSQAGKAARVSAFMGTYALVWGITGIVPLALNTVVPIAALANENGTLLVGASLVLLSGYQLSPFKHRCLKYCRTPLSFLMEYHNPGVRGAVRMSFQFSLFCVGCCWALFALMVVVGSMNILWMAVISVVLSLERMIGWGDLWAKGVGIVAGVGGSVVLLLALM